MDRFVLGPRMEAFLIGDRWIRLQSVNDALVEVGVKKALAMAASDFALPEGEEALLDSDQGTAVLFWEALEVLERPLPAIDVWIPRHFPAVCVPSKITGR